MIKVFMVTILLVFTGCSIERHSTSFGAQFNEDLDEVKGYAVTQTIYYK